MFNNQSRNSSFGGDQQANNFSSKQDLQYQAPFSDVSDIEQNNLEQGDNEYDLDQY